ncbi:MAG TPA: GAF domain-containing protein [Patescibacteria group bacterium]|nr:GAF domain-containing protein [Patescibacteria group bacterium]
MPSAIPTRPTDATLSVTKAARLLGVHPNTVRAWSDAGRLRYYRINPRGDRRYRIGDLQRFLSAAESVPEPGPGLTAPGIPAGATGPAGGRRSGAGPVRLLDRDPRPIGRDPDRHRADLALIAALGRLAGDPDTLDDVLRRAASAIRDRGEFRWVTIHALRDERLQFRAGVTPGPSRMVDVPRSLGLFGRALDRYAAGDPGPVDDDGLDPAGRLPGDAAGSDPGQRAVAIAIPGDDQAWGVLAASSEPDADPSALDPDLLVEVAAAVGMIVEAAGRAATLAHQVHRADALRRVAADIGSRLELDEILSGLVDHAIVLFNGQRAAVFLRSPEGRTAAEYSRGLSQRYLDAVLGSESRTVAGLGDAGRQTLFATGFRDDPRVGPLRAAVVQEGFDTICTTPLLDGTRVVGVLHVYHDSVHEWTPAELDTMGALADQAAIAIKNAQNYERMATWAAQLQSIQQLGARLSRLANEEQIGVTIAAELRQLIDYHNVRVYRLRGDDLIPVAMRGQVGEYVDETPEQLMVKFGQGITGWVAKHRLAENLPDASADPRANTIAGTDEDLDESMLLAPMVYEDQVLGVLVLSKLGLHQFTGDDLRLLVIYASFAAQAFANADATGLLRAQSDALARQLANQRALLQITESILTTLDPRSILDQVAERLSDLVGYDNLSIELLDRATGLLRPLTANGVHASEFMKPWLPGEEGLTTWVVAHNEPALVRDELHDARVRQFRDLPPVDGSLICVPLRGRDGATGVLTLERLGLEQRYSEEEFELVKLFAAQVSIALQNAEVHRAVEIRAQTDDLTGLLNHGTFQGWLGRIVQSHDPFSLIMLDLDNFKHVNDDLGHQAGDRLLAEIARALEAAGRESDGVFRYGGDEFALILPGTDGSPALGVAERVRAAIGALGQTGSTWAAAGMSISVSMGVATFPRDGRSAEEILLAADRACFVAKRTGTGLIATADEGLAIAREFSLQAPTPIDTIGGGSDSAVDPRTGQPAAAVPPAGEARPAPGARRPTGDATPVS